MTTRTLHGFSCAVIFSLAAFLNSCGGTAVSKNSSTGGQPSSISLNGISPSSVTLIQGSSQAVTVTLSRTNFTGSVSLSLSALPSGVTSNIPQPGTGNSGSITLQAASSAALVSNQNITVTASGTGVSNATRSFSLTVVSSSSAISEQILVVGQTDSANFPTSNAFQSVNMGNTDGFVSSIQLITTTATTSQFTFSSFLGGSGMDQVRDVFLDSQGNVYVTGRTGSAGLPTTAGAFQPTFQGGPQDGFVTKLSPTGQLIFLTYLGGSGDDVGYSILVDSLGFIYVSGRTSSPTFPGAPAATTFQFGPRGGDDCFVVKMQPNGSGLVWATFIGGSNNETARGRIVVDSTGAVYIEGVTSSADFPTTPNAFQTVLNGTSDAFVAKLSSGGSQLIYSTYLGGHELNGRGDAATGGLVVNSGGEAFVCGLTGAPDFPTTLGAFQGTLSGIQDMFIAHLSADGHTLLASTLLGGSGDEACQGLAFDSAGDLVILGFTTSFDFPTTLGVFQTALKGTSDLTVTKISKTLSSPLIFSTYVGGSGDENGDTLGVALDANDNIWFIGSTTSTDFPVTSNAVQKSYGGGTGDACIAKLSANAMQLLYGSYLGGSANETARSMRYRKN